MTVEEFLNIYPIYSKYEDFFVVGRHPTEENAILLLAPKSTEVKMDWSIAQGHFILKDLRLPDRIEQMLLWKRFSQHYATDPLFQAGGEEAFEEAAYWSGEEYEFYRGIAWLQGFGGGYSDSWGKNNELFGRAVRTIYF